MNTVTITPIPDKNQVRVTIHSAGERDQSALIDTDVFDEMITILESGHEARSTETSQ